MKSKLVSLANWIAVGFGARLATYTPTNRRSPSFSLDHIGCVVDQLTIDAVLASDFLRDEFAHVRAGGATTADGASWSNVVILGELTYIELLPPESGEQLGLAVGESFIALHADEAGGVQWLAEQMSALHPESKPQVRFRAFVRGRDQIPWFYFVTFDYDADTFGPAVWAMEYHPEFKHRMSPALYPEPGDISRRRAGPAVAFHPEKYFRDVGAVRILVSASRRSQLADLFNLLGLVREDRGLLTVWRGADFEIVSSDVSDAPDYAMRRVRLELTRPLTEQASYRLSSSMTIGFEEEARAFLDFRPPVG